MKSTTFEHHKIETALRLLSMTVPHVWKTTDLHPITISQERLLMWPEHGDLAEINRE